MDNFQDWKPVVFSKSGKNSGTSKKEKDLQYRIAARTGNIKITSKSSRINSQKTPINTSKLDNENEIMKHDKIDVNFGKALMQARMAAKITQKQLAQKLNVKHTVIQNYEKAKGIPNPRLISNLERALNCKLPRKKKKK